MNSRVFGWDLPPGVSNSDLEQGDWICEICHKHVDNCECPECPVCGDHGNPNCYENHGLKHEEK
jgi:uncharacterized paraquat-inducible protein A